MRAASGTTTYVLTDRCKGYTIESGMHLELGMSSGDNSAVDQQYAAWEAKDNSAATFRMLTYENGSLKDSYHGTAILDAQGAGTITYAGMGKEQTSFNLPSGTLLSTAHTAALLKAAARGEKLLSRPVADGTFDDGPYRIAAVIGPPPRGPMPTGGANTLEAGAVRPFGLAYFPIQAEDDEPRYELTMSLYPNGVAKHMVQDFGGFSLAFDLISVTPVADSPCP